MVSIYPGHPQPVRQATCTGKWGHQTLFAYISGSSLVILDRPDHLLQSITVTDGELLAAVALSDHTTQIAVSTKDRAFIYDPSDDDGYSEVRWTLRRTLKHPDRSEGPICLSWGAEGELLLAQSDLYLYSTLSHSSPARSIPQSSPAKLAAISLDSSFIVSVGTFDRFVKVLRRLSFDTPELRFDRTYLGHPEVVTDLQWKRSTDTDVPCTLYTICTDGILRVWVAADHHHDLAYQIMPLRDQIDLRGAISPRSAGLRKRTNDRYAFVLDSAEFDAAFAEAMEKCDKSNPSYAFFEDLRRKKADVCCVLDRNGHLSAWGIEKRSNRTMTVGKPFNIGHLRNSGIELMSTSDSSPVVLSARADARDGSLTVFLHSLNDGMGWFAGSLIDVLDPLPKSDRFEQRAYLDGHSTPLKGVRCFSGDELVCSWGLDNGLVLWKAEQTSSRSLVSRGLLEFKDEILDVCEVHQDKLIALLSKSFLTIFRREQQSVERLVQAALIGIDSEPRSLCQVVTSERESQELYFLLVTQDNRVFSLILKIESQQLNARRLDLGLSDQLHSLETCAPIQTREASPQGARARLFGGTKTGSLALWSVEFSSESNTFEPKIHEAIETDVQDHEFAACSPQKKAVIADKNGCRLTIWNMADGALELTQLYDQHQAIEASRWTTSEREISLLAIRSGREIAVLSPSRLTAESNSCWTKIFQLDTRDSFADPIVDMQWLGNEDLIMAHGQQITLLRPSVAERHSLSDTTRSLTSELPAYSPRYLMALALEGRFQLLKRLLVKLLRTLKFFTEGDNLELEVDPEVVIEVEGEQPTSAMEEPEVKSFIQLLQERDLKPYLKVADRSRLTNVLRCANRVMSRGRELDDPARRFLLLFLLRCKDSPSRVASYEEISWAYHSNTQEALVAIVLEHHSGRLTWPAAKECGIFLWLRDAAAVRMQFESLARNIYASSEDKNPTSCSLHYLALQQKPLLLSLWKRTYGINEQANTVKLLSNDFTEKKWQTAAKKNAYALLSRHRFEYAAAFFLLSGDLKAAANVCAAQLGDSQLAIAVARVHSGDGPANAALVDVVGNRLLPAAAKNGDRWAASWHLWMLDRKELAIKAIYIAPHNLLDVDVQPFLEARDVVKSNPTLLLLYREMRGKLGKVSHTTFKDASKLEYDLVLRTVQTYSRMGMESLALQVAREWRFMTKDMLQITPDMTASEQALFSPRTPVTPKTPDPRKAMERSRRRSSRKMNKPATFEEPEANSLLDSFGF